jgi:putative transposase
MVGALLRWGIGVSIVGDHGAGHGQRICAGEQALAERFRRYYGSEFCSKLLDQWAFVHSVQLDFIQPGKPVENAFIESFNGRVREECLNAQWFDTLAEAKAAIEAWRIDYNRNRPHGALGQLTPREFRRRWSAQQRSIDAALLTR